VEGRGSSWAVTRMYTMIGPTGFQTRNPSRVKRATTMTYDVYDGLKTVLSRRSARSGCGKRRGLASQSLSKAIGVSDSTSGMLLLYRGGGGFFRLQTEPCR
jgi:hypothetical protein